MLYILIGEIHEKELEIRRNYVVYDCESYETDYLVLLIYASGYAAGNFIGMKIDEKLTKGNMTLLIITDNNNQGLADELREKGFGVTTSKGYRLNGSEKIQLLVVLPKSRYAELRTVLDSNENGMHTAILDVKDAFSTKMATPRK